MANSVTGLPAPEQQLQADKSAYKDSAESLSAAEKIDFLPKAPDPMPFTVTGGASGKR